MDQSMPFNRVEEIRMEAIKKALQGIHRRSESEDNSLAVFEAAIRSLRVAEPTDLAAFLDAKLKAGQKIEIISDMHYYQAHTIYKTTQSQTALPDFRQTAFLDIIIMPCHSIEIENASRDYRVYDLNNPEKSPSIPLYRDVATAMLDRGWRPCEQDFEETCSPREIDKLLSRGKKFERRHSRPTAENK